MRTSHTRTSIAKALNISQQTVAKYLSGSAFPTIERLMLMSEIFGIPIDTLVKIDLTVEDFRPLVTPDYEKVDNVEKLTKALNDLTQQLQTLKTLQK